MTRKNELMPILPAERDPRLITMRRGGTLTDEHHRLPAEWAALCAEHVLHFFEQEQPRDTRPRDAHRAAFVANAAARGLRDPAKFAALAARQAVAVAHVAAHDLGAAAYAIRATVASASASEADTARVRERDWQRERIPTKVRELVLDGTDSSEQLRQFSGQRRWLRRAVISQERESKTTPCSAR
jgi:Imm-5 like putative immunity protein